MLGFEWPCVEIEGGMVILYGSKFADEVVKVGREVLYGCTGCKAAKLDAKSVHLMLLQDGQYAKESDEDDL